MFKRVTCLVLGLLLVLAIGTTALADSSVLSLLHAHTLDDGYVSVTATTDYTANADMSFTAKTENGDLEIVSVSNLRDEGTSWFVILEYNYYYDNSHYAKTQKRALKTLADSISDVDEGALVRCDTDRKINLEKAGMFRSTLTEDHKKTNPEELLATVKDVEQYIIDNPDKLKPNVAIVIITACPSAKITRPIITEIGQILDKNFSITTHIIVTVAETGHKEDKELGDLLISQAELTAAGTGFRTQKLSEAEADKGIQLMNEEERRKIMLILDPVKASAIGKKITVTQTTSTDKVLTSEADLSEAFVTRWEEKLKERPGTSDEKPKAASVYPFEDSGSVYRGPVSKESTTTKKSEGMSTELLVGIIAGVVVLALLVALLIMRANKNKKAQKTTAQVYASSASGSSASSGTTITLSGANGSVLKGQMKGGKLTVGRNGAKAMLTVPSDGKLSGLHATFTKQGNQMMITDNGSTNGTKVNGNKIPAAAPMPVHQNDTITLGSTTYTISWR